MLTPTSTTTAVADGVVGVSASLSAVTSTVPLEISGRGDHESADLHGGLVDDLGSRRH